ncbi:MAG: HAMP domain-containing protein [Solirubrobacterales bacterium]
MSGDADARVLAAITRRLIWTGWIANIIGAGIVFVAVGFLLAVFFDADQRDALGQENLPILIGVGIPLGLLATWLMARRRAAALSWFVAARDPDAEELRLTLGLPGYTATITAGLWGFGAILGFLLNLDHSLGSASLIGVAFWIGGESTGALAFLLSERQLRPVTERALAAHEPTRSAVPGIRDRLLFAWILGTGSPIFGMVVVGIVGLTKPGVDIEALGGAIVFLGGVAVAIGLLATLLSARAITEPLNAMRSATDRVGAGDFDVAVAIDDASEVGLLQAGFNRMAEGLQERERIRDLFGRQVGHEVARSALREGTRLGGEEREIGALFVDLTGSTSMALAMPPTAVVRLLNRFFRVVIEVVESEGGFVNKFEGDAALCVFGAPAERADPAGAALCAARCLAERLDREVPEIGFGIGVSAGSAVAGNVGSEQRFEYTVIGDPVNEAARLSDLAKERAERVIASNAALDRASDAEREEWEGGEQTVLRGRLEATRLAVPKRAPAHGHARAH